VSKSIHERFDHRPKNATYPSYSLRSASDPEVIMLDLRMRNGDWNGLGYSYIGAIKYDRTTGLVVSHTTHRITLQGRNLEELYAALLQQTVVTIEEQGMMDDQPREHPVVNRIQIEDI